MSSNSAMVINIFSVCTGKVDLVYLSISIFIINLYQFLILCSSKVLLLVNVTDSVVPTDSGVVEVVFFRRS